MLFVLGLVNFKALIEESEMKKFPDNDLLRHLRLVTQDAEKCASVAQQLLNGKRQTRYLTMWEWHPPEPRNLVASSVMSAVSSWRSLPCLCRYRSGGGKSQNQLTVNELRQFVTQLYALPCVLSQTPLLKVTISRSVGLWVYFIYSIDIIK